MAEVIEVNSIHELAGYRLATTALLADTPRASFFHTLDWLEAYWRHYGRGQRLRALVVRAGGQTIGLVTLVVKKRWTRLGPMRVLTYPLDHWGSWYGPLGANQAATLTLAMRHVAQPRQGWDLIDLPWVDHKGDDRGRTTRALRGIGWGARAKPTEEVSLIEFAGGYEEYLAGRSAKLRHDLRRTRRRVQALGRVEFVRHRPAPLAEGGGDPRWDLYEQCEAVATNSWQAGSCTGNTLTHTGCREFLRDAHAAAARQGMVDLCLLKIDGKPVAYAYNYHREGRLFGLRMGYCQKADPSIGLGKAMFGWMIEDSFGRGDRVLELGEGDAAYKHRLRTGVSRPWRVQSAPLGSFRAQAAMLGGSLTQRLLRRVG